MDYLVEGSICVIPARGGSKRIKNKNIVDFGGKPMIAWTIEAALDSGLFNRILVSTDDPKIARVAQSWGAESPFLRQTGADDFSEVSVATIEALIQAEAYWGETYDSVTQLMPNCPLRNSGDIQTAFKAFESGKRQAQISCFKFGWMNPWWAFELSPAGVGTAKFPSALKSRSQDLPSLYCPTGAIWIASSQSLKSHRSFYMPGHTFEPIPWISAVDIDDESDLEFARFILSKLKDS